MLRLRGLMAVAPLGEDPAAAFARLAGDPRAASLADHPDATWLSAGMSGDLEARRPAPARHTCASAPRSSVRGRRSSSVDNTNSALAGRREHRRKTTS